MLASDSLLLTYKHHYDVKGLSGKKSTLRNMQYFLLRFRTMCCDLAVLTGILLEMLVHNVSKGPFIVLKAL